jgi:hypothetical protein
MQFRQSGLALRLVSARYDHRRACRGEALRHAESNSTISTGYKSNPFLQVESCHRKFAPRPPVVFSLVDRSRGVHGLSRGQDTWPRYFTAGPRGTSVDLSVETPRKQLLQRGSPPVLPKIDQKRLPIAGS